jgi:hypothetical protein
MKRDQKYGCGRVKFKRINDVAYSNDSSAQQKYLFGLKYRLTLQALMMSKTKIGRNISNINKT